MIKYNNFYHSQSNTEKNKVAALKIVPDFLNYHSHDSSSHTGTNITTEAKGALLTER